MSAMPDHSATEITPPPTTGRLASLDVFRGLTIAGMILVNNPGSWGSVYAPLKHAEWNGCTPTDLVFPFFLFIVGVSITFGLSKRLDRPAGRGPVIAKILRRTLVIFGLGLFLNKFPFFRESWHEIQEPGHWSRIVETIRIPGVLQRIALCYFAASMIFLFTRVRGQVFALVSLLVGYYLLERFIPGPGFKPGDLARGHELSSYLDRLILKGHLYKKDYDPEGLLSTLPSIATTLLGVLTGHWLRSRRDPFEIDAGLFLAGTGCAFAGWTWGWTFPVNKALWTGSFVLQTGGLAMIGLAICYWLIDLKGFRKWAGPFRVFGANAIAAYTLAAVGARLLNLPAITEPSGDRINVHTLLYDGYFSMALSPFPASLAFALTFVLACFLIIGLLDLVGIHIRA